MKYNQFGIVLETSASQLTQGWLGNRPEGWGGYQRV